MDLYRDFLILHINVIEDHVDDSCSRGELGHRLLTIRSIAHVLVAGIACVDDTDQQCAQAKNKSNEHQMLQGWTFQLEILTSRLVSVDHNGIDTYRKRPPRSGLDSSLALFCVTFSRSEVRRAA